MRSGRSGGTSTTRGEWARLGLLGLMAGLALSVAPGCGVGLLIGAAVGGYLATDDGGSSSGSNVPAPAFLSPPPDRLSLRELGNASIVRVCFDPGDAEPDRIVVQFAREADSFVEWRQASALAGAPPGQPCAAASTIWWDAQGDLGLAPGTAELVRVRVLSSASSRPSPASPPFHVGSSPPVVSWLLNPDDREGDITLIFSARDGEGDPLEDVHLTHEVPGEPDIAASCDTASAAGGWPAPRQAELSPAPIEAAMVLSPQLSVRLEAPASGVIHSATWDSRRAIGDRDVKGLEVRLRCRDAFGTAVAASAALDIGNNHPPEARLVGGALGLQDRSFEVPIPFELIDADGHDVDIVVQLAIGGESFRPLPEDFADPGKRRDRLERADFAGLRRELRLATPASRALWGSSTCGLTASARSERHVFVWDSGLDLGPASSASVRLRITPFDASPGRADESAGALVIDNELFTTEVPLGAGDGVVGGTTLGDLDGDDRLDAVISLAEAPTHPEDAQGAGQDGRVDVYFRREDGSFDTAPLSLVPGLPVAAGVERHLGPLDVETADLDRDGLLDLVVLVSNCPRGACSSVRGQVAVFFGPVQDRPLPLILDAGGDVRSLCLGDFDGENGLDIAVSNHDPTRVGEATIPRGVGVFLQGAPGQFHDMVSFSDCPGGNCTVEPGLIACGDFTGDGRDDIAVRQRLQNRIRILELDLASGSLVAASLVELAGDAGFSPVSLAAVRWNDDALADLVVGSRERAAAFLLLNRGGGSFEPVASACLRASPEKILLADLAGDRRPELIAFEQNQTAVPGIVGGLVEVVELGEELACCANACALQGIAVDIPPGDAFPPPRFAAGDADRNGRPDLLLGSDSGARLILGGAAGGLETGVRSSVELLGHGAIQDIVLADVNGDRLQDLVAASSVDGGEGKGANEVLLFYQDVLSGFPSIPSRVLTGASECTFGTSARIAVLDVDGDRSCDLLALSRLGGIDLFWREGSELPATPSGSTSSCTRPLPAGPILLGDLDGIPGVDLLRFDSLGGRLLLETLERYRGERGRLAVHLVPRAELATDRLAQSLLPGDFNGDGLADIVLHFASTGKVSVFTQEPAGVSTPFPSLEQPVAQLEPGPGKAYPADLDGDGRLDVLVISQIRRRLLGFCQAEPSAGGPLTFRQSTTIELGESEMPLDAAVEDLSGDGRPDIAVAVAGESRVRVYYQCVGGGFPGDASWFVDVGADLQGPSRLAAADVSGDSRPDLVVVTAAGTRLVIVRAR